MTSAAARSTPLLVAVVGAERDAAADDLWRVGWLITNAAHRPVHVTELWLPHSQFRGERQAFEPALILDAGEERPITSLVRCSPQPGKSIENAFLILRVQDVDGREVWRVLAQIRIECERDASIRPIVEKVTAHPVGFGVAADRPGR